ncbi:J domain-containing protein [Sansalvadorimonas verongulae]|uniref:J domain-containing protein n=1 Tax=Sansalvadorimonas verongulae TaxID=2172824 RepID=UPI0012BB867D|nr:J domain-containing protein [Sansalvadorimonas verongulae]MTI14450.1 J domain-containing protein [Sansalvadorimonas verongulae]
MYTKFNISYGLKPVVRTRPATSEPPETEIASQSSSTLQRKRVRMVPLHTSHSLSATDSSLPESQKPRRISQTSAKPIPGYPYARKSLEMLRGSFKAPRPDHMQPPQGSTPLFFRGKALSETRQKEREEHQKIQAQEFNKPMVDSHILTPEAAQEYVDGIYQKALDIANALKQEASSIVETAVLQQTQAMCEYRRQRAGIMVRYGQVRKIMDADKRARALESLCGELSVHYKSLRVIVREQDVNASSQLRILKRRLHDSYIAKHREIANSLYEEAAKFNPSQWPDNSPEKTALEKIHDILQKASTHVSEHGLPIRDEAIHHLESLEGEAGLGKTDRQFADIETQLASDFLEMNVEQIRSTREGQRTYPNMKNSKSNAKETRLKEARKILGVTESCTDADLRKAYKQKALANHPDKHPDNVEVYTSIFQKVNEAYTLLTE